MSLEEKKKKKCRKWKKMERQKENSVQRVHYKQKERKQSDSNKYNSRLGEDNIFDVYRARDYSFQTGI